jgi:DNA ligase D-like protein (predicted ligase)
MNRTAAQRKPGRLEARALPGARPAPFPGFIEPCHPTLREKAPFGERWVHEIKFDGYRAQAHLRQGRPAIYTRRGYDWTRRFQPIAEGLATLPADDLILDGEAVVADSRGVPDFGLLHADLAAGRKDRLLYFAFDLLYLDGFDLRAVRLAERKRMLLELLSGASERILYAEHLEGDGPEIHERACAMGLEGIVSKQQDAPYRSGRTESWIKVKCGKRGAFPIVAFVEKLGAKPRRIASLYMVGVKGTGCFTPARCAAVTPRRSRASCASGSIPSFASARRVGAGQEAQGYLGGAGIRGRSCLQHADGKRAAARSRVQRVARRSRSPARVALTAPARSRRQSWCLSWGEARKWPATFSTTLRCSIGS